MTTVHQLTKAERLLTERRFEEAHAVLMQVHKVEPKSPDLWFLMGILSEEHGVFDKALTLFRQAIALDPAHVRAHAHAGRCLIALNRADDARAAAETAAGLDPKDAHTLDTIGVVFSRAGMHAKAAQLLARASGIVPSNASYAYNLGSALQFLGRFDEAEAAYDRVLALDPAFYKAASAKVQLRKQDGGFTPALEAMFSATDDADARLHIGHALAKTAEDVGDYSASLKWLLKAKAGKRAQLAYQPETDEALFRAAMDWKAPAPASTPSDEAPIFVVGLPRTGTTLVDRILSSHPEVASAGELSHFALLVKRAAKTPSKLVLDPDTLRAANGIDLPVIGRAYIESARALVGGVPRFVDKMPLNVFYAGLIHAALPKARIVCLRRDPMDACLSNFRQLFATGFSYYNYAYDLEDTARYYLSFDNLIAHWRAVLPAERFTEVAYEGIVADQEGQTRRLLDFCGLAWDPACLAFHENTAPVATASSVQVRSPLYSSSIGRWKRYGDALAPLAKALGL